MKVKLLLIAMFLFAGTITTFASTPVKQTKTISLKKSNFSTLQISAVQLEKNVVNENKAYDCFGYSITLNGCFVAGSWCGTVGAFILWLIEVSQEQ
jgi:hypothetical protein